MVGGDGDAYAVGSVGRRRERPGHDHLAGEGRIGGVEDGRHDDAPVLLEGKEAAGGEVGAGAGLAPALTFAGALDPVAATLPRPEEQGAAGHDAAPNCTRSHLLP
jgi:hypothetical protein